MHYLALKLPGQTDPVAVPSGIPTGGITDAAGTGNQLLQYGLNIFLVIVVFASLAFLIMGGIRYITSGGDAKQTAGARNQIIYAVIGLFIAIMAYVLVNLIGGVVGVKLLK